MVLKKEEAMVFYFYKHHMSIEMENKRKQIGILFIIILIIIIRSVYIWGGDQIAGSYYVANDYKEVTAISSVACHEIIQTFQSEEKRLYGLELKLLNLPEDGQGNLDISLFSDEKLFYCTSVPLSNFIANEWYHVFCNVSLGKHSEYSLHLNITGTDAIPEILIVEKADASPEVVASSADGNVLEGQVVVGYAYREAPSNADKILKIILWIMAGLFSCFVIIRCKNYNQKLRKIFVFLEHFIQKANNSVYILLIEFLFGYLIFERSGIEFQSNTKMIFWLISCLSVYKAEDKVKYMQKKIKNNLLKVLYLLLNFYAAFSLVGNYLFVYPLNKEVIFSEMLIYLITVIWFLPITSTFIYYYGNIKLEKIDRMPAVRFGLISVLLLIIPAVFALYAFNPGISSVDTSVCMAENAHAIKNALDWHPIFYCILLKGILKIWDSTYMVIYVQWFFWVYVILRWMLYMRKKGISDRFLLVLTGIIGVNTVNWLHICTIWKDVPYAIALLWITLIIVQFVDNLGTDKQRWYLFLELTIALVLCCLLRKNGIIPYLIISVSIVWFFRKNIKLIGAVGISVIMVMAISGPLYSSLGIISPNDDEEYQGGKYIGLGQDILGVYYGDGKISLKTMKIINGLTGFTNSEFKYNPYWAGTRYDLEIEMDDFIINYIDTFIHSPITMIRSVLCRHDAVWNILPGKESMMGCVAYYSQIDEWGEIVCHDKDSIIAVKWNDFYPEHEGNEFSVLMARIADNSAKDQLLNLLEWRCGLHTLVLLMAGCTLLLNVKRSKAYLAMVPFWGHVIGLLLSTGWADFRYYWPLNLISIFLVVWIPTIYDREAQSK